MVNFENRRPREAGFSLLELIVAVFIALIGALGVLLFFQRGNQKALNQDEIIVMNQSLNSASTLIRRSIGGAGFGFSEGKPPPFDFALRTFENFDLTNVITIPTLQAGDLEVPKAQTDAIVTTRAIPGTPARPGCERAAINPVAGGTLIPNTPSGKFTLIHCTASGVGIIKLTSCNAELDTSNTNLLTNPASEFNQPRLTGRSFLLHNVTQNTSVNIILDEMQPSHQVQAFSVPGATGCSEGYLQISGNAGGLQFSSTGGAWSGANPGDVLMGYFVETRLFYLGDQQNLYSIPGSFRPGSDISAGSILTSGIDDFQLAYFLDPAADRDGKPGNDPLLDVNVNDQDGNGLPDTHLIDQVDMVLIARSNRFDPEYKGNEIGIQSMPDVPPVVLDPTGRKFRRRIMRENVLAKNL